MHVNRPKDPRHIPHVEDIAPTVVRQDAGFAKFLPFQEPQNLAQRGLCALYAPEFVENRSVRSVPLQFVIAERCVFAGAFLFLREPLQKITQDDLDQHLVPSLDVQYEAVFH